jgi:hypothetical protein
MSCATVPTPASDGMDVWKARTSEQIRKTAQLRRCKRRNTNRLCSVHPDAPRTPRSPNRPQSKIPRVNSLLTMAKRRLAERFRAHEFALLRRCKVALGRSFMRSFWVFFAPLAGWSPKALLIGALNNGEAWRASSKSAGAMTKQPIGPRGRFATPRTFCSAAEEEREVERRRPRRGGPRLLAFAL